MTAIVCGQCLFFPDFDRLICVQNMHGRQSNATILSLLMQRTRVNGGLLCDVPMGAENGADVMAILAECVVE